VPTLGESVSEATVAKWLKKPGDAINIDEILVELETEKVSIEVPSFIEGRLEKILVAEGKNVDVGAVLAVLSEQKAIPKDEIDTRSDQSASADSKLQESKIPTSAPQQQNTIKEDKLSPAPARILREHNIASKTVTPTGPKGNITKSDALKAIAEIENQAQNNQPSVAPVQIQSNVVNDSKLDSSHRHDQIVPMSRLRKVIARRLKEAQDTSVMLTTFNEINMDAIIKLRHQYKEQFERLHSSRLGFMSFFVKAVVLALQDIPEVNAQIRDDHIIYHNYYDISVAIGSSQGLVVPVLRDADQLDFAGIEGKIADFSKRANAGKLTLDEMSGGTFTITNGGVFGSLLSTPIINPPQTGILGMHKIMRRPICVDDKIVAASMMYVAFTYDHRLIDGRQAVTFLVNIKDRLEDPTRLLLNL
ncbi:MAG: 2-oxoglutarate dehydrogenase complex dihydrolipoyllysine-residue succinyltransferase, partial [Pseudomonadota bacterium]